MPRARHADAPHRRPAPPRAARHAGASLVELIMVLVVLGLVAGMALPRFAVASEEARADAATAVLRSIWLAERMHWLEQREFADDLTTLVDQKLIEGATATATTPFVYSITAADAGSFTASAVRQGSSSWSGTLTIDEAGLVAGSLTGPGGRSVAPLPD